MSKQDPKLTPANDINPDLLRRTEAAILAYMNENDGRMPTQQQVNDVVSTSFTRLGPAVNAVKERLLATQTRLANMPEIPEELKLAHDQMLKELWAKTRDLQNSEIVDLRRAQEAKDANHRQDRAESQEIIALIEARCDAESARAEKAEAELEAARETLANTAKALTEAQARLTERESIVDLLRAQADKSDEEPAKKSGSRMRKSPAKPVKDEVETDDLPGITTPASSDADDPSPEPS